MPRSFSAKKGGISGEEERVFDTSEVAAGVVTFVSVATSENAPGRSRKEETKSLHVVSHWTCVPGGQQGFARERSSASEVGQCVPAAVLVALPLHCHLFETNRNISRWIPPLQVSLTLGGSLERLLLEQLSWAGSYCMCSSPVLVLP